MRLRVVSYLNSTEKWAWCYAQEELDAYRDVAASWLKKAVKLVVLNVLLERKVTMEVQRPFVVRCAAAPRACYAVCPVLTWYKSGRYLQARAHSDGGPGEAAVGSAISLCAPYAMPGTDLVYGLLAYERDRRYAAVCGTDLVYLVVPASAVLT
eukprot:603930-Rhodomonas_salina.1